MAYAAGAYALMIQNIEGYRTADLQWGTANGKYAVLRFCASISAAAAVDTVWSVALRNGGNTYSYVIPMLVPGGIGYTNKEFTFVIPPCTAGTWPIDSNYAMSVLFALHVGSTFRTANTNLWISGNFFAPTNITEPIANATSTLTIGDVGLYADPNLTGRAPEFQQANYEDDLADSQRYWYKATGLRGLYNSTTTSTRNGAPHPVPMRVIPTPALVGATLRLYDAGTAPNITGTANTSSSTNHSDITLNPAAAQTQYRRSMLLADAQEAQYIAMSAR